MNTFYAEMQPEIGYDLTNAESKADAAPQQPESRAIQPTSRRQCTNSRKSPDRVKSTGVSRAQVEPPCTLDNRAKRLGVI